jgi:threonyl-tRNA synthetase
VGDVFGELIESSRDLYKTLGMTLKLRLSFRDDKDGYIGTPEMWKKAESAIQKMADKLKMDYFIGKGEAAMYGPKMDFMAIDALGREWQLDTVQLDYALPTRFHLEYVDADGTKKTPVMVHCALLGSLERFMSVYLEHTAGWLPMWCAPENVRVLTVNDKVGDYVEQITAELDKIVLNEPLPDNKLRYTVDDSSDSLGKKIKRATGLRIPCIIIVGPQDAENNQVSIRLREGEEKVALEKLNERIREI